MQWQTQIESARLSRQNAVEDVKSTHHYLLWTMRARAGFPCIIGGQFISSGHAVERTFKFVNVGVDHCVRARTWSLKQNKIPNLQLEV